MPGTQNDLGAKLDRLIGEIDALTGKVDGQGEKLGTLAERVALLEQIARETREVLAAWTTAKTAGRLIRWVAALLAGIGGIIAAIKGGGLHR
ncbi:hypothetical protein [Sphingobium lignivorans]|uniref:Uncharacterized protein n=1 Tax=Sphingobium lignivorans TaxID=2735886 RepID=A0ABR6NBL5_9SPHN|nr:hypothetical protein [Sphingobium lignivorans]MBB5984671.1 hypothetical protein [Sphingobium lignivorans]